MPVIFGPLDSTALKTGMMEITASVTETICKHSSADHKRKLKLHNAKKKSYMNIIQNHCQVLLAKVYWKWLKAK